ncbi:helix-turn-helix domain-containing protein [Vibrio gazogenes]|uniref:Transcriptional regulator, Nlp family n=1 Tax=Vibrio gazogenes DSM 21264 = NBRC 103151 TaxID=1123492 RepID=A0A1M5F8A3_VIBGA|nr:helix-turn-helix domain-containing protein [Vibrio gazogenes]USP15435.1 helix-turn-helix domain-containing protein [Vibrio gazogenes]SHF87301.1 transcriptional regulator, Nlp family [Vibrio gazogenes DSM 21264] [Vibrio gazogenes DSM 21264 = NBRC 103151]SJN54492.1 DNA-binding transcriptional regulator Nlp [Vibrio gazogenes]
MKIKSDMPSALIVAHLKMKGLSIAELSRMHGYHRGTLNNALRAPWPKGERIIADALDMEPENIWPTRYPEANSRGAA